METYNNYDNLFFEITQKVMHNVFLGKTRKGKKVITDNNNNNKRKKQTEIILCLTSL